jgi:hypothetical protein
LAVVFVLGWQHGITALGAKVMTRRLTIFATNASHAVAVAKSIAILVWQDLTEKDANCRAWNFRTIPTGASLFRQYRHVFANVRLVICERGMTVRSDLTGVNGTVTYVAGLKSLLIGGDRELSSGCATV